MVKDQVVDFCKHFNSNINVLLKNENGNGEMVNNEHFVQLMDSCGSYFLSCELFNSFRQG